MKDPTKPYDHFLIVGEIVFQKSEEDMIHSIRTNGVLIHEGMDLPVRALGKAQQILQANFRQRMGEETNIKILDVVLANFVHLGKFTQSEFHAAPEGSVLREKIAEPVVVAEASLEDAVAAADLQKQE